MADVIEMNCETGEVVERDFTPEELVQRDLDTAAAVQRQADETAEQTRIDGIKASIAAKRTAKVWEPFTDEEAAYLSSVNQ